MNNRAAFTLVELSIVLVIIGLLTGGVLSGQSLIHAAEVRAVITDSQRYVAATNAFRDKYQAIPGDMRNATSFWGFAGTTAAPGCVSNATPAVTAVSVPGTCDGNGDGKIDLAGAAKATGETFRAWQHLALAGMIEGSYTGNAGIVKATDPDIGINVPKSKFPNSGWGYGYYKNDVAPLNAYSFKVDMTNWMVFGGEDDNDFIDGPIMKPEDAWNIDSKLDDGKPGTGSVIGNVIGGCTTAGSPSDTATATYALTTTTNTCGMVFKLMN